jgi:hypothetical protein
MAPSMCHINHHHAFQLEEVDNCGGDNKFSPDKHSDSAALTYEREGGELRRVHQNFCMTKQPCGKRTPPSDTPSMVPCPARPVESAVKTETCLVKSTGVCRFLDR